MLVIKLESSCSRSESCEGHAVSLTRPSPSPQEEAIAAQTSLLSESGNPQLSPLRFGGTAKSAYASPLGTSATRRISDATASAAVAGSTALRPPPRFMVSTFDLPLWIPISDTPISKARAEPIRSRAGSLYLTAFAESYRDRSGCCCIRKISEWNRSGLTTTQVVVRAGSAAFPLLEDLFRCQTDTEPTKTGPPRRSPPCAPRSPW